MVHLIDFIEYKTSNIYSIMNNIIMFECNVNTRASCVKNTEKRHHNTRKSVFNNVLES